jgi:DtxR family Mn-dependent transcriptional regulator
MESPIVEDYLEAIYKLKENSGKLGTTKLGKELAVSPASASEMMERLVEKGLAAKDKEKGIQLTRQGKKAALRLIRRHRISERFLVDVLGMDWKDVHEVACKLEHAITPEVESRMEGLLRNLDTCPHGHPIPDRLGRIVEPPLLRLSGLKMGQTGVIAKIAEENRELLEYLATLGMMPEAAVKVEQVEPFEGPLLVRVKGATHALGRKIADKIWIKKAVK